MEAGQAAACLLGPLAVLALGACQSPAGNTEPPGSPLEVLEEQQEAWNRGDLEAFVARGYVRSDTLSFYSGGEVRRGYDALLERYRLRYQAEGKEMGRLRFSDTDSLPLGAGHALVRGRWGLEFADGQSAGGLFTLLMARTPAGWRILHDHTSEAE